LVSRKLPRMLGGAVRGVGGEIYHAHETLAPIRNQLLRKGVQGQPLEAGSVQVVQSVVKIEAVDVEKGA
jgi:hypothetical protein